MLDEIDRAAGHCRDHHRCARRHEPTSAWTVQQQLEHLLQTDRSILGWLHTVADGSAVSDGIGSPTMPGRVVMTLGIIPRGRGRAPDFTRPQGIDPAAIEAGFAEVRARTEALTDHLPALATDRRTLKHPALGYYTAAQWLRFAQIHHRHHGNIIRDILKATR